MAIITRTTEKKVTTKDTVATVTVTSSSTHVGVIVNAHLTVAESAALRKLLEAAEKVVSIKAAEEAPQRTSWEFPNPWACGFDGRWR